MPSSILQHLINKEHVLTGESLFSPVQNSFAQDMDITISMLRLDCIHPHISGNKLFKLQFFLEEAFNSKHKTILTFGGTYSNHLAATAFAARSLGLRSIGLVRGERPIHLSDTLIFCEKQGMKLEFISRELYREISTLEENNYLQNVFGSHLFIPEGGFSVKGMEGACEISNLYKAGKFSHICVAVGTATTLAGILKKSSKETEIVAFPALKGLADIPQRLQKLGVTKANNLSVMDFYHFGGFGKRSPELISFMNRFYTENRIPLDIVYTGKMMFGVMDLLEKNYFPAGSEILCIHTGGLQGNSSAKELLVY